MIGRVVEVQPPRFDTVNRELEGALGRFGLGLATAVPKAIMIVLGLLFSPLRWILGMGMGMGGRSAGMPPTPLQVPSTPFRVQCADGTVVHCLLRGEQRGTGIYQGADVEVRGRFTRARVLLASSVRDMASGASVRGHVPAAARYPVARGLLKVAAGLFVLLVLLQSCGMIRLGG
ncbi:MAG: hypothetical protein IPJ14_16325 [Kineosporiaceae bacterium]|nr:hypothetical protein [Kineosporiaceae bacterium]